MTPVRALSLLSVFGGCVAAGLIATPALLHGDTYQLILQGVVQMKDGSAPPKTVSVERICSDVQGSAPGPITNKKGEYLWRMEVDPMKTRSCTLRAHLDGYVSSEIDISALNSYSNTKMAPLILTPMSGDPTIIAARDDQIPAKSHGEWKAAMKAIDAGNFTEAGTHMEEVTKLTPKFAGGWNSLGLIYSMQQKPDKAKEAYEQAIAVDPKMIQPYLMLARYYVFRKDWDNTTKLVDQVLKLDTKHAYSEVYLHQAAARYGMKDFAGAETSVNQALKLDQSKRGSRAEYVLGRILEAKGDMDGARQHMLKYLELDPTAQDAGQIKEHIDKMGKPDAPEPDLELL